MKTIVCSLSQALPFHVEKLRSYWWLRHRKRAFGRLTMLRSICCLKSLLLALCLLCTLQRFTNRTRSIPEGPGSSSLTWTLGMKMAIKIPVPACPLDRVIGETADRAPAWEGQGPCLPGSLWYLFTQQAWQDAQYIFDARYYPTSSYSGNDQLAYAGYINWGLGVRHVHQWGRIIWQEGPKSNSALVIITIGKQS